MYRVQRMKYHNTSEGKYVTNRNNHPAQIRTLVMDRRKIENTMVPEIPR